MSWVRSWVAGRSAVRCRTWFGAICALVGLRSLAQHREADGELFEDLCWEDRADPGGELGLDGGGGGGQQAFTLWRQLDQRGTAVGRIRRTAAAPCGLEPVNGLARGAHGDRNLAGQVEDPCAAVRRDEPQELELTERQVVFGLQPRVENVVEPGLQPDQVREQGCEISHSKVLAVTELDSSECSWTELYSLESITRRSNMSAAERAAA